jgi:hypothetical protein
MRIPVFVRHLLLLLAFASPALLRAQFQKPTDEELKMTADPKALGAAAVYLNVEKIPDDPLQYRSFYARIKVLTETGKKLATISIPFRRSDEKVVDIKARTIHADGTVIPLRDKPQDLTCSDVTTNNDDQRQMMCKAFALPSVEVGSILEYSYREEYESKLDQFATLHGHYTAPQWVIQRPYPVRKAHYVFTPNKEFLPHNIQSLSEHPMFQMGDDHQNTTKLQLNVLKWQEKLPEGSKMRFDIRCFYSVDVTDIPPAPGEEPFQSDLYHVFFHYENVVGKNK